MTKRIQKEIKMSTDKESIRIGDKSFLSHSDASTYTGNLLANIYRKHNGVVISTTREWNYLYDLLTRHPSAEEKIGKGIKAFIIRYNDFKKLVLHIQRTDNTIRTVSWRYCINLKRSNQRRNIYLAMRSAVWYQLHVFRENYEGSCAICNKSIDYETSTIHHESPTFEELMNDFTETNPPPVVFDTDGQRNQPIFKIEDVLYKRDWEKYHEENCNLLAVHYDCHRRIHNQKEI